MAKPELTIIIVTWNSAKFLDDLINSFNHQTFKDYVVTIIDNASTDSTIELIEKKLPQAVIIKNQKNLDFAQANNQGIALATTPYVLLANHDLIMDPGCIAKLMKVIKSNPRIGSVGAKLLRWKKSVNHQAIIDSSGLKAFPSRRFIERGENMVDQDQFNQAGEIFGSSGALILLRKSALNDVSSQGEVLDDDFIRLKEDVDLAFRLRWQGWRSVYAPGAVAWHKRGTARQTDPSNWATIVNRKMKSAQSNYYSYRNHFLVLLKNESVKNFLLAFPQIFSYELKKFLFILLFEQKTLFALFSALKLLPRMLKKRKIIMRNRKISNAEMRKWFTN